MLHRDVKPADILIEPVDATERVYLTDFGIARLHDDTAAKLTRTGTFTATSAFASPEQLSGIALDGRAISTPWPAPSFACSPEPLPSTAPIPPR